MDKYISINKYFGGTILRYKKIILLAIFLVSLLAVSAVSAGENTTDDFVNVEKTDEVVSILDNDVNNSDSSNENDYVLSVEDQNIDEVCVTEEDNLSATIGTFTDLANDISNADGELNFTKNYIYSYGDSNYKQGIEINKKIIINGNGFGINGNNQAKAFRVSSNVILKNIEFTNCYSYSDTGVVDFSGVGSVVNCSFVGNYAKYGGAVYFGINGSVVNCSFVDNSANDGGAVYFSGVGSVVNCSFVDNSASSGSGGGGAIYICSFDVSVVNCSFVNCNAGKFGGAIYSGSGKSVVNCSFVNCTGRSGGAVYFDNVGSIVNCSFVNNSAYGGGAMFGGSAVGCRFINNSATDSKGGAIYSYSSDVSVVDCSFVNNYANEGGGAIYHRYDGVSVVDCSFVNNVANKDGGAVYFDDGCSVVDCSFVNNVANKDGGAIYFNNRYFAVNSSFINNSAINGGAIYGGSAVGCSFINNSAIYEGAIYSGSAVNCSFISISISTKNIYVDEIAEIEYTFESGMDGMLSVYVNDILVKNVQIGNKIKLENLSLGNYNIKVIYNVGDYTSCSDTTTLKVFKLTPSFTYSNNNAIAGDEFVITYILNDDATGTITCNNSTKQLINGRVTFNINNIKGGLYQFNFSYSGDNKYNPMDKTVNVNIKFKDAVVEFDVNDIIWSDTLTIVPTVPNSATGYINIYIDNILNGTININDRKDFTFYNGGYHSIKVTYSGDEYYSPNSTTKGFNVIKLNSTCDIEGNIEVDNSATVYVTLNEDATGEVSITVKGTKYISNLINGVATFRVPSLAAGTYSVTIDYEGDSKYNSIYTTKTLEVTLKPSTIDLNVKNILSGNNLVVKPIVTSSASGNLKIYVDNVLKKTIAIGSSYTIITPSIGKHDIRVVYDGDSYHQGCSNKTSFRVFTFYPIEVQNSAIIYGTNKHFQAIFYDEYGDVAANKLIAFRINGEDTVVMTDSNGLGVFNKDLPIGTYYVTAINAYVNEEHTYALKIFTSIESEDMTRAYNTGMDFKVKLLDENADTLSKGYALFNVNNKDYPVVADNDGIANLNANLPVGIYTITTTNGRTGEIKINKITIVPSVEATNMVRGYNSGVDFKAKFLDADAKPLINQEVAFKIGSIEYEATTDVNGFAVLNEQLDVGKYEVRVINKVTGENAIKNLTIEERMVENNDVIRIYGEESYYTIHVVGDDGNFVGANEIVNININNVDYQIMTNVNGYASFRIDENIGSYDIFAEYKGYYVYNKIYVLQNVNFISKLDVENVDYKHDAVINMLLSSFDSNALVKFEVNGENGYYEIFGQLASNSIALPVSGLNASKYTVTAKYYDLNNYKFSTVSKSFNVNKINPKVIVVVEDANVGETAKITVNIPNVSGNVEIKVDNALIWNEYLVKNGVIIKEFDNIPAGYYKVDVTYQGDENYNKFTQSEDLLIIQPKTATNIIVSPTTIKTTFDKTLNLVATLIDDSGNILSDKGMSIFFNGKNNIVTTDAKGQVKLTITNLVPKSYTATITFAGNDYYLKSTKLVKVTISKTTPKLTAKAKTFKKSVKTKKYTVTLKTNQNKVMKNTKVTLKVNGKTYSAKTNTKGQATFKITKLTKKGKFTAVVKFAGNKYYNAKTVKPKIIVK